MRYKRLRDWACGILGFNRSLDCVWNVMAHAQKPDFIFRRNGPVHLNRRGRQLSRILAAEVCTSAVVMLGTPSSEVLWRVLATHSIRQFPLYFPSHESPSAITFQLDCTKLVLRTVTFQYRFWLRQENWRGFELLTPRYRCLFHTI
jgi:hypothetical protein